MEVAGGSNGVTLDVDGHGHAETHREEPMSVATETLAIGESSSAPAAAAPAHPSPIRPADNASDSWENEEVVVGTPLLALTMEAMLEDRDAQPVFGIDAALGSSFATATVWNTTPPTTPRHYGSVKKVLVECDKTEELDGSDSPRSTASTEGPALVRVVIKTLGGEEVMARHVPESLTIKQLKELITDERGIKYLRQQLIHAKHGLLQNSAHLWTLRLGTQPGDPFEVQLVLGTLHRDNLKATKLVRAISEGDLDVAERLLSSRIDPDHGYLRGKTYAPMHVAVVCGHLEMVQLLCDADIDRNMLMDGTSAVCTAVITQQLETVRFLCDAAADVNKCRADGRSPLSMAIMQKNLEIVRLLCEARADMDSEMNFGVGAETPLIHAISMGELGLAQVLCEALADVNKRTADGESPLVYAAHGAQNVEMLRLLHKAGANMAQDSNDTPLAAAVARCGNVVAVRFLIGVKANLEEKAKLRSGRRRGKTPLRIAAEEGDLEVVKLLCEAGAKKDINCVSAAADRGHRAVAHYLRDCMMSDIDAHGGLSGLLYHTVSKWFTGI
eukprot:gnl/TRDRNA2_/TRDRNA2_177115_c4_seq3.p1 gnl/TRDRNA2_/TRDRNA2_177115_c4~~gnl/TRDRNA2_/TRDRNA2_177115_c4_seq3.p1  ORF type:complete len:557 (-),score=82.84 gnl/TRDRNA2_/TRDRNA2_177115_c4_seq3:94-1764(-)